MRVHTPRPPGETEAAYDFPDLDFLRDGAFVPDETTEDPRPLLVDGLPGVALVSGPRTWRLGRYRVDRHWVVFLRLGCVPTGAV